LSGQPIGAQQTDSRGIGALRLRARERTRRLAALRTPRARATRASGARKRACRRSSGQANLPGGGLAPDGGLSAHRRDGRRRQPQQRSRRQPRHRHRLGLDDRPSRAEHTKDGGLSQYALAHHASAHQPSLPDSTQSHGAPLSLRPAGLADGLAPKEQRYPRLGRGIRPTQLGSPAPRPRSGIRHVRPPYPPKAAKSKRRARTGRLASNVFALRAPFFEMRHAGTAGDMLAGGFVPRAGHRTRRSIRQAANRHQTRRRR